MLKTLVEKNTFISSKPETLLSYYLVLTHYLILTNKYSDAIKVIKTKLIKSSILNKVKHTLIYFEAKYYFRYLQFLLSMKDIGKCDKDFQKVIENETPLSLLEECYSCVSSVARYHMENSVDLSRSLNNTHNKDNHENFFFNIGKAECYRILNESLNIMEVVCKYYIEISRYRDACGFIREGMDLTQLHFAPRRVTTFLLLQANADLVASCTIEAASRIKVAERIINDSNGKKILLTPTSRGPPKSTLNTEDLHNLKSYFYLNYLNHMKLLKETKQPDQTTTIDIQEIDQPGDEDIFRGLELIKSFIETNHQINEFCNDILIETYFLAYSIFKLRCHKAFMEQILAWIKSALFKSKKLTFSQENWHLAEYYCCVFEFNELFNFKETLKESDDQLKKAIVYIKANPHPTLYRRICFHLFKTENNVTRKVMLLLETQSIALRHKACAIQIKQMRKSSIESGIYEKLTSSLSFNEMDSQYLFNFVGRVLPSNSVAVALVLNNMNDLFIIRLERDCEPFFYELKYNQKYNESFKQIMIENDLSMKQTDRTKFWSTRNTLNKRLYKFLEDLESNVFTGVSKALLLGSYLNLDMKQLVRSFKRDLRIASLTESQERLISVVLLGIEYLTTSELTGALRQEFSDSQVDKFSDYLLVKKIDLAKEKRKHICLLIDKNLHQIPWECLPTTKDQLISRMPSIHFLQSHIQVTSLNINKDKTYYIVDPGSDLTHTREKFQTFFEKKKNWNGLVGVAPNEDQFKRALTEYELFIYTGHGSGSQYYPSDDVQKLRVQACSILMGCSSGNQYVMGDFEPYGTVLAYILAGCPCIVGNLWDVTDRDIDRLTEDFLDSWIKNHEDTEDMQSNSICFHLTKSRAACKMQYLNGSAPIVYGLPVNFK
jgi:separase